MAHCFSLNKQGTGVGGSELVVNLMLIDDGDVTKQSSIFSLFFLKEVLKLGGLWGQQWMGIKKENCNKEVFYPIKKVF